MREYEKHQAANGNPPSHAFAKELMAGIAAAEVGTVPNVVKVSWGFVSRNVVASMRALALDIQAMVVIAWLSY